MNKCLLQRWEFFNGVEYLINGCSLHIDSKSHNSYVKSIYNRSQMSEYDVVLGDPIICFVSDSIFMNLLESKNLVLLENEFNNLYNLEDIIIKEVPSF
jgi:hypothetical protein